MNSAFKNINIQILLIDDETKEKFESEGINLDLENCTEGNLCKRCENENGLFKCTDCNEGYFLPNNFKYPTQCSDCTINCKKCENENKCNECIEGFKLKNDSDFNACILDSSEFLNDIISESTEQILPTITLYIDLESTEPKLSTIHFFFQYCNNRTYYND